MIDYIITLSASVIAILFVLVPHEYAHAFAAYKNGDWTAKLTGRLTLNPVKHFDPIGFLLCAFTGFGWAKPVPINPNNFRKYKKGLFTTAIAGVITNYVISFVCYPVALLIFRYVIESNIEYLMAHEALLYLAKFLYYVPMQIYSFGLTIFVFNMLPLNPLDGFRVVEALTSPFNRVRLFLQRYGSYILIGLIVESYICTMLQRFVGLDAIKYLNILGFYVQTVAKSVIGFPICGFWDWIFGLF